MHSVGASAVILGGIDAKGVFYEGLEKALTVPTSEVRLFGKPEAFVKRRMGVALATADTVDEARARAVKAASMIVVKR
jgi:phosphoribosylglycinamide formyltransferase 2